MDTGLKVYKFGGASVKDADAVRNIPLILSKHAHRATVIILSAMDKTTNHLEKLVDAFYHSRPEAIQLLGGLRDFHLVITKSLFKSTTHPVFAEIDELFNHLQQVVDRGRFKAFSKRDSYDLIYDQIVPYGELLSTKIVSHYLNEQGLNTHWHDARQLVKTDSSYREGRIDWDWTCALINQVAGPVLSSGTHFLTQGFIAGNADARSVTLGREGSDFTASIFAYALDASEVVFWKDVPGLMNADPKDFKRTSRLEQVSYGEAVELSFYGAKVIHPKTIKPLQNKSIPLRIKSFMDPEDAGSLIQQETLQDTSIPSFIIKLNQVLISFSPRDHSFIAEEILHYILGIFIKYQVRLNLMQTSAITLSVCVDNISNLDKIIEELKGRYYIRFNKELTLITIRHYTAGAIKQMITGKEVLLEQRSRSTVQYVVKNK